MGQKIESLQNTEKELSDIDQKAMILSGRALENRKKNPTGFSGGKIKISEKVARNRRKETFKAAAEIHGGIISSSRCICIPPEIGLADTVRTKCSTDTL